MQLDRTRCPDGFADYFGPLLERRRRMIAELGDGERAVAGAVLRSFLEGGRGPQVSEAARSSGMPEAEARTLLEGLSKRDFLVLRADDRVTALYPFSDEPCPHTVGIEGGKPFYGM